MVRYCDVVGSAYFMPDWDGWEVGRGKTKPNRVPDYLWVLYSQYVIPIRMAQNPLINFFQYFAARLPYEDVMWFRQNHSLRDPYGASYSPTYAGDQYASQEDKQIAIYDQVLGLGPRPNLIATAKDSLQPPGETERKRLEQDLIRRQSAAYAGGVLVNNGAWEFTPVSYSPADLAGKEISEYDLKMLATIFGQPPTYYTVDSNLANLQAADQQHARDGVEPRCKMISDMLTQWVRMYDPRLFWEFDPSLPEDEELKAKIIDMKLKNGSITINQANLESEWPPVEWGDEPWIAGTLVQPSMAREKHELGLKTGEAGIDSQEKGLDIQQQDADTKSESAKSSVSNGNGRKPGDGSSSKDRSIPAIHGGPLEARFDAILASMERSLGL
jgi:hypothetical protein